MDDAIPTDLEVYIGSFSAQSFGLWWDGDQLVYETFRPSYEAREQRLLSPSNAQWRRFWRTVDTLDVWDWEERYGPGERFEPSAVTRDGTHWSLALAHGGRRVESSGDTAGPDSLDLDDSHPFTAFLGAVSRLIGERPFH